MDHVWGCFQANNDPLQVEQRILTLTTLLETKINKGPIKSKEELIELFPNGVTNYVV